jgi:hypothetical protein
MSISFYKLCRSLLSKMSRRTHSPELSPRAQKKQKLNHLTSEDYKNGVFLAPMVRSGARKWLTYPFRGHRSSVFSTNQAFCSQAWCNHGLEP